MALLPQIEDKHEEKKRETKNSIHIQNLAQTLTHIIMQTITVYSGLQQISLVLSLQTDLC